MPEIELNLKEKKFAEFSCLFYTINVKESPSFSLINGQNIILDKNDPFVDNIKNNHQKLSFKINRNKILPIKHPNNSKRNNVQYEIGLSIESKDDLTSIRLFFEQDYKIISDFINIFNFEIIKTELIQKKEKENEKNKTKAEGNYPNRGRKDIKKIFVRYGISCIDSTEKNQMIEFRKNLLESKVGLENQGATCYMASILQVLIHTDIFLKTFYENYKNIGGVSKILYNLFNKILSSKSQHKQSISLEEFVNELNEIDSRYNSKRGNNPILFFTHFIEHLDKENNYSIKSLFSGKKSYKYEKYEHYNYIEDFLIYIIQINENSDVNGLNQLINLTSILDMDNDIDIMEESIIESSSILIINIDNVDSRGFKIEHKINILDNQYELYAINSYNDHHSTL